jgi:HlyD family secretion protein
MTANLQILTDERANVLRIPNAALRFRPVAVRSASRGEPPQTRGAENAPGKRDDSGTEALVYRPDASGEPQPVRIRVGITDGSYTEVLGGDLREGVAVIAGNTPRNGSPSDPDTPRSGSRTRAPRLF